MFDLRGGLFMGWDDTRLPWAEFERRLSWRRHSGAAAEPVSPSPVATPLPSPPVPAAGDASRPTPSWAELHVHSRSRCWMARTVRQR